MKRSLPILVAGVIILMVINISWAFEVDPLSALPISTNEKNLLYFEINDVSIITNILNGNWFKNLAINVGNLSQKELKNVKTAAMMINRNVKEASCAIYFRKKINPKPDFFIIIKTHGNALQIIKASGVKLQKVKRIYRIDMEDKKIYAYFGNDYVMLSNNEKALYNIVDPLRLGLRFIWKTKAPRGLKGLIPAHKKPQVYLYLRMRNKLTPRKISILEGKGRDEKTRFIFDLRAIEPREGLKNLVCEGKLPPISPPGKGKIILMGAVPVSGDKIISTIKNTLPKRKKGEIDKLYKALSTNENELSKFLTGKLYLVVGGNANILGTNFTGIYAYYLSEMNQNELKAFLKRAMGSVMKRAKNGGFFKEERKVGWDLFYSAVMPVDLTLGVRGKELILGLIPPSDLDFRMVLPPDICEEIGEPASPWAYLSLKELKELIPKFVILAKNFNSDKETINNIRKLSFLIPPWRGILFTTKDPAHARFQILYR
ncbi:MAG: hypothetical protein J7M13_03715 [Synergistetes bacterium]|nr:hypothetical protein [Synergistota bacterium]